MLVSIILLTIECSAFKPPLRIYGGKDAKSGEFPHVVRIEKQRFFNSTKHKIDPRHSHACSGSALSPVWVVSAAHCLSHPSYNMVIRYGHVQHSFMINNDSFSKVLYTIEHPLYAHDRFIKNWNLLTNHDIGLLKTTPMNIQYFIKVSAVDYKTLYGHEAVIAGYGYTTKMNAEGKVKTSDTLSLKKPLQLLTALISKCSNTYTSLVPGLCLAARCGDVNIACPGDSGGALIHPTGLIGVMALSELSGFCLRPVAKIRVNTAVYVVPITPYIEWIYSYVND